MPDPQNQTNQDSMLTPAEACAKVAEIYHSGANWDKAVLQVLQSILKLPPEIWDFNKFYSDKPDDTDRFVCKVLAAGALAIYLDIVTKSNLEEIHRQTEDSDSVMRAVEIINAFINMCSGDHSPNPADFDPFKYDPALAGKEIDKTLRKAYAERVTRLLADFQSKFGVRDCVDILGFDPFSYEDYDEETQEKIESGEWMQKCVECMQHVITTIKDGLK